MYNISNICFICIIFNIYIYNMYISNIYIYIILILNNIPQMRTLPFLPNNLGKPTSKNTLNSSCTGIGLTHAERHIWPVPLRCGLSANGPPAWCWRYPGPPSLRLRQKNSGRGPRSGSILGWWRLLWVCLGGFWRRGRGSFLMAQIEHPNVCV